MQKFESTTLPYTNQNFIKPIVPYWNSNEFSHFQEPFTATVKQIPAKIRIYDQLEVYL